MMDKNKNLKFIDFGDMVELDSNLNSGTFDYSHPYKLNGL